MSSSYEKYQKSRDASWEILADLKVNELPVKPSRIASQLGIKLCPYCTKEDVPDRISRGKDISPIDGFSTIIKEKNYIFFNETNPAARIRFTISHEMGHLVLGHVLEGNGTIGELPDEQETVANVFASRLLAPACVLWGIGINSPEEIQLLCDISAEAAEIRYQRMQQLYQREQQFLKEKGKSCFLLSPKEREVYHNFYAYIEAHKK